MKKRALALHILSATIIVVLWGVWREAGAQFFPPPTESRDFKAVLIGIGNFVVKLSIPVLTFFIVLTGIKFVAAQGNEEKLKEAKKMFYWVVIGGAVLLGADVIAKVIFNFAKSLSG